MKSLEKFSDRELVDRLRAVIASSNAAEAEMLIFLGEVDARRIYADEGFPSMFAYCTDELGFSEASAYSRITAARAARKHPQLVEYLRSGELHLAGIALLCGQLSDENCDELLASARGRSKREIAALLADRRPKPAVRSDARKLPSPPKTRPAPEAALLPSPRPRPPEPLGTERFKVQFTADRELYDQLKEAQALLRHRIPDGDLAVILRRALELLLREVRRERFADVDRPRSSSSAHPASRHIPAAIRREVFERDGGRCTFVARSGRRCGTRDFLEYHHVDGWARSRRHSAETIVLMCRTHNQREADREFGEGFMSDRRASAVTALD